MQRIHVSRVSESLLLQEPSFVALQNRRLNAPSLEGCLRPARAGLEGCLRPARAGRSASLTALVRPLVHCFVLLLRCWSPPTLQTWMRALLVLCAAQMQVAGAGKTLCSRGIGRGLCRRR